MNEIIQKIGQVQYKHICISIVEYSMMLSTLGNHFLDVVTSRDLMKTGLFATVFGKSVYVSRDIAPGFIKFSNKDIPSVREPDDWTCEIPIEFTDQFERISNLKAFW
jgi:hypothetical protein